MADVEVQNQSSALVASANVVGLSLQVGYPWQGSAANARTPVNLRAVAWPDGRRIDLKWTNPQGVTRVLIKRSGTFHSAVLTDSAEVIYNGGPIEHFIDGVPVAATYGDANREQAPSARDIGVPSTNAELAEDTFYYYTVYLTVAAEPVGIVDFGAEAKSGSQVTGLSIMRYFEQANGLFAGDWLYRRFGGRTMEYDQEQIAPLRRGVGFFQGFCRFVQAGLDLERGYVKALDRLGDPSRAPAGLVGFAYDQASILSAWVHRYGIIPDRRLLDVGVLRRLSANLTLLMKQKGRADALVDFTKALTTWDSTSAVVDDGTCNAAVFKTWDGTTSRQRWSFQASLVALAAGRVITPAPLWEPDAMTGGVFIGPMGDKYHVLSNDVQTLVLDTVLTPRTEDLLTISAVAALGGGLYRLTVTRTAGGPSGINDNEYAGYQLVTAANTLCDVEEDPTNVAGTGAMLVRAAVAPLAGAAAVAPSYLLGAAFANRDPQFLFDVYSGCIATVWNPKYDETLEDNPNYLTYGGGALTGVAVSAGDVIVTIAEGVAMFIGESTTVSGNVLTDTSADFGAVDSLVNRYLNPNRNQTGMFRIVANTATTITVEPMAVGEIELEDVGRVGAGYFVLDLLAKRRYESLTNLLPNLCPTDVFVYFG